MFKGRSTRWACSSSTSQSTSHIWQFRNGSSWSGSEPFWLGSAHEPFGVDCRLPIQTHASAPSPLCQSLLLMFFWHPHPTFDFWHHHSKHKHHDRPTPPLGADSDGRSPSYEVFLEPAENPQELTLVRRWLAVICISTTSICVTCASSMVRVFCFITCPQVRCLTVAYDRRRSWRCL
jgi:hypothetical protein